MPESNVQSMSDELPLPLTGMVESLLFVSDEPVHISRLAEALEVTAEQVEEALAELREATRDFMVSRIKPAYPLGSSLSMVDGETICQWQPGRPAMQCDDLTDEQARALKNKLQPMLGYLNRLKQRMRRRGFRPDDRLLTAVCRAEDALYSLHVEVHYLACGDKVARLASKARDRTKQELDNRRSQE